MSKLKQLLFWCLIIGTLSSCSKDDDPEPNESLTQDYIPTSTGTSWSYEGSSTYTQTVTGNTKMVNNKKFYEVETVQGSNTSMSFISKDGGVYVGLGVDPRVANVEMTFLKENEAVGSSWEQTDVLNGITTKSKFTLMHKGMTKTVNGKEYKDVIHVKLESIYTMLGMEIPGPTGNYFYAKGVGMILTDFGAQGMISLKSYTIK